MSGQLLWVGTALFGWTHWGTHTPINATATSAKFATQCWPGGKGAECFAFKTKHVSFMLCAYGMLIHLDEVARGRNLWACVSKCGINVCPGNSHTFSSSVQHNLPADLSPPHYVISLRREFFCAIPGALTCKKKSEEAKTRESYHLRPAGVWDSVSMSFRWATLHTLFRSQTAFWGSYVGFSH